MIGIVPLADIKRKSFWMLPGYMEGLQFAGALPFMLPFFDDADDVSEVVGRFDGFLFTGGQDVSPALYGEERLPFCGECCDGRDKTEMLLLEEILKKDVPLLGICRGLQFINAALGGSLYQDIRAQTRSTIDHVMAPPYDAVCHDVIIAKDSPLYRLLCRERIGVNSYHHQGVKKLSHRLKAMAVADDGITEAAFLPEKKFVWAVQWHPEFSYRTDESGRIFSAFVAACR